MAIALNLDSLVGDMKVNDFLKAFKNKSAWKKAKHVLIMVDYKLDGKKLTVAIPYKKPNELKQDLKKIKKDKIHVIKKVGLGTFKIEKSAKGPEGKIQLTMGGLNGEAAQAKIDKLFGRIKLPISFVTGAAVETDENINDENQENEEMNKEEMKALVKEIQKGQKVKQTLISNAKNIDKLFTKLETLLGKV